MTLALMGSSHGETEPEEATHSQAKAQQQNLDLTGA